MVAELQETGPVENNSQRLAKGLGYFSIGLGLAELLAPRAVANVIGIDPKNTLLIRLFGLREISCGIAIFAQGRRPSEAMWSRCAGDALDIAAVGASFFAPSTNRTRLGFAAANVLAVSGADYLAAKQLTRQKYQEEGAVKVRHSIFIGRSPEECYAFWRDLENLPTFMHHLHSVKVRQNGTLHWVVNGPAGSKVSWDAEITEDRPNHLIAWRSMPGSKIENRGLVRFERAPANRGTILRVELEYCPPAGVLGMGIAKLFREEPKVQIKDDLRRFKQVIETGEVVLSDASPKGNGYLRQRAAQPQLTPSKAE